MGDTGMAATTFGEALARFAAEDPERPAITCGSDMLSRGELERRSNQLARAYAAHGVRGGDFVSIVLGNSPDYFAAAFAIWKLGAVPQPLSPSMTSREISGIVDLVRPAGVVGAAVSPAYRDLPSEAPAFDDRPLAPAIAPVWKATVTGGSTGRPKVIVVDTPAVVEQIVPVADSVDLPRQDTVVVPGPLHHNAPFLFATLGLLAGSHVVLQSRFDAERLLADVAGHRAGWLYVVPTMMQRIWRLDPAIRARYDLSALRRVVHMAAPCPSWLKRAWIDWLGPDRLLEVFSATESLAATRIDGNEWLRHPGSVGRPAIGEIEIWDEDETRLPPGRTGRVWLRRGPGVPAGYHYIGSNPNERDGGWQCLGDVGYFDEDGYLYLTDRDSDMIVVGGSNVYPAELEAALDEHPAVLTSCVIGLPHADLGAAPHAIVQTTRAVPTEEFDRFLRDRISPYKLPRSYEFTDQPLRDDAGKVRRAALRAERVTMIP
ncbi:AMP-binding protein [Amycolatopsis pigmentata]|uniref:AMP-binding protein n=1 Tax=Amycolatopsis pigmentata TaxID=450801 RepID=A0ABW5G5Q0_9PSEU